ncbi:TetR/AcrR family transcriptional regulator C-terminal domain-containing protein [Streptomyces gossypii]|uniref:TetR/AcrR family transcriptional regulator C-terminal domain-containing protein n=1 Tax=Streptomyces gossypii TaxID=2883101 RepID=UPI0021A89593|nr:TetR/AcrR family transcriptional regulator C-terminal domain-containing protein [Streptomyces gossypii]
MEPTTAAYGRLLGRLTDADRFPEIPAVLRSGILSAADGPDDDFRFGLDRILDGVATLVTTREAD